MISSTENAADLIRHPTSASFNPPTNLKWAVLQTLAYADVFDYPLTIREVHRYLVGARATLASTASAVRENAAVGGHIALRGEYASLAGREEILRTRARRNSIADGMWPKAVRYGLRIARLPFVRMVAVTGALAVDNVEADADIDYLVVTEPGRLWLCRAFVIALVRLAAREGITICPNYFLSERALVLEERNLFVAHELAQMIPISGLQTYMQMRQLNAWTATYLPNSDGLPRILDLVEPGRGAAAIVERMMQGRPGAAVDRWEMERKVRKFGERSHSSVEVNFSPDWCKGHFDGHGQRIMDSFAGRLRALAKGDCG